MLLDESNFLQRSTIGSELTRYAGKGYFIHFSQVNKLGVNPKKFHSDPYGVYFYSLDWLMEHPRFLRGTQFATDFPYWFIVRLDTDARGVVLSKITKQGTMIAYQADQNGWLPEWERDWKRANGSDIELARLFWHGLSNSTSKLTPNKMLRGFDFVWDDGLGIIHYGEENQLLVLNPRAIKIVASGKQGESSFINLYLNVMKRLRGQYSGEITWKADRPTLALNLDGASLLFKIVHHVGEEDMEITAHWGRTSETHYLYQKTIENETADNITDKLSQIVNRVISLSRAGQDLFFKPLLDEKHLRKQFLDTFGQDYIVKCQIDNKHKTLEVTGHRVVNLGSVYLDCHAVIVSKKSSLRYYLTFKIGDAQVLMGRGDTIEEMVHNIEDQQHILVDGVSPQGYMRKHFRSDEDFNAFIGFLYRETRLKQLASRPEVETYNAIGMDDLSHDINWIYGR